MIIILNMKVKNQITLSIKEYLNMIRPYLRDIINDHKTQGEWKAHLSNELIHYKTHSFNNDN